MGGGEEEASRRNMRGMRGRERCWVPWNVSTHAHPATPDQKQTKAQARAEATMTSTTNTPSRAKQKQNKSDDPPSFLNLALT